MKSDRSITIIVHVPEGFDYISKLNSGLEKKNKAKFNKWFINSWNSESKSKYSHITFINVQETQYHVM